MTTYAIRTYTIPTYVRTYVHIWTYMIMVAQIGGQSHNNNMVRCGCDSKPNNYQFPY